MMKGSLLVVALAFLLSACGGGGDSSDEVVIVDANPAGVWKGCLTTLLEREDNGLMEEEFGCDEPLSAGQHELLMVADENGYFRAFGVMGVSGGENEAGETRYIWEDDLFLGRGRVAVFENDTIEYWDAFIPDPMITNPSELGPPEYRALTSRGELITKDTWSGTITVEGLRMFQFNLEYDERDSQKGASVDQLASVGFWQDQEEGVLLKFNADGSFTTESGSTGNCRYEGTVSVPDSSLNYYRLNNVTVSHTNEFCGIPGVGDNKAINYTGSYGGVATLVEIGGISTLKVSLSNKDRILELSLTH